MAKEKTQRNAEIFIRFLAGESYGKLSQEFGISTSRIAGIIRHTIFDIWIHNNKTLPFDRIRPRVDDMRNHREMLLNALAEITANEQSKPTAEGGSA